MTERQVQIIARELRKYAPIVNKYTSDNGYYNFDFFYNGEEKCWECLFFNSEDTVAEAYIAKSAVGIINLLDFRE
jgi:hypothetical protein